MTTRAEKMEALKDAIEVLQKNLSRRLGHDASYQDDRERLASLLKEAEQYNYCSKTVKPAQAYEVWRVEDHPTFGGTWTWLVLKKYASPAKERQDICARWFCLVDGYETEMGDVYVQDITSVARKLEGALMEAERARVAAAYRY